MIVLTRGIRNQIDKSSQFANFINKCVLKFLNKDWGDTNQNDCKLNNIAIKTGDRIVAKYKNIEGNIFIVKEHDGVQPITTILFCNEY